MDVILSPTKVQFASGRQENSVFSGVQLSERTLQAQVVLSVFQKDGIALNGGHWLKLTRLTDRLKLGTVRAREPYSLNKNVFSLSYLLYYS